MTVRLLAGAAGAVIGAGLLYDRLLRRQILTWGATDEEAGAHLPGDELLRDADGVATRAITINAPASAVWPWIAQMGPSPRGGAYTYDWIENLLGLDMHSTASVLPEYQHPQVGQGFGYGSNKMSFKIVDPEHVLATQSADGNWVWSFILHEHGGRTRLISRNRFRLLRLRDRVGMIPMEPASLIMERKMLRGIKWRSERLASAERPAVGAAGAAVEDPSTNPGHRRRLHAVAERTKRRFVTTLHSGARSSMGPVYREAAGSRIRKAAAVVRP